MELIHKWKLYDYVSYQTYRFSARDKVANEIGHLDESISEPLQSVDMMCFSSQYYFMAGIHSWGMLITMWGVTVILRNDYNLFSDRMLIPILVLVLFMCNLGNRAARKIGDIFKIWKLEEFGRHRRRRHCS